MKNKFFRLIFYLICLSIILGPLTGFQIIQDVNIYLSDALLMIVGILLVSVGSEISYIFKRKLCIFFFIFCFFALVSLLLSPLQLTTDEIIISSLYLIRLISYFLIYPLVVYLTDKKIVTSREIIVALLSSGFLLGVLGWLQYLLYFDLRNLLYLGWDPHYKRIFSTYFDPNFFGLMMVLTFILTFFQKNSPINWIKGLFILITLAFTYSRSSILSLFSAVIYYSILTKKYLITAIIIILVLLMLPFLPRPYGNESVKLERLFTLSQRVANWKEGLTIFSKYPITGIGFNTLRYYRYNESQNQKLWENHAAAGVDNSFLFILVTTGIIGMLGYLYFLFELFKNSTNLVRITLAAVLIHSLFINSFFFPFVMIWIWVVIAFNPKNKKL